MNGNRIRWSPAVRVSMSGDGVVLLDIRGGQVLATNPVATAIVRGMAEGRTAAEIARAMAAEYGEPVSRVEADVLAFVADLERRGFLEESAC